MYAATAEIGVMAKKENSRIVMEISERALKFEGARREIFLARVCGDNQELYKEVISLFQSIDESGSFMQLEIDEAES